MSSLYSSLPQRVYTLKQFVRQAKALTIHEHQKHAFIRFLITGEYFDQHQAVVDPIRNILENDQHVDVARDYDSVIGIADRIVVTSSIAIYPIPKPVEALSTSIHIKYPIEKGNVSVKAISGLELRSDREYRLPCMYLCIEFPTSNSECGVRDI